MNIDVQPGFAEHFPVDSNTFDLDSVFLWSVIEHVESHDKTIDEIYRVLRPCGYAVINGTNRLSPSLFTFHPWSAKIQ